MAEDITLDEILAEMGRLNQQEAKLGYTTRELMEKTGRSSEKTKDLIRLAIAEGLMRPSRGRRSSIDGILRTVPVYVLVPQAKKPHKKRAS